MLKYFVIIFFPLLIFQQGSAQSKETQIKNLFAFAKLAGDIRYFSSTDIAHQQLMYSKWDRIFINGTKTALQSKNHQDFADSLVSIFKPIEPSLAMIYKGSSISTPPKIEKNDLVVSVQHRGLELYAGTSFGKAFQSIRLNRRSLLQDSRMSTANFMNKNIPVDYLGKEFEIKINYDSKEDISLQVSTNKNKILTDKKIYGKGFFTIKDTLSETNLLMNIELLFDDVHINLSLDSMLLIGNEFININELEELDAGKKPIYSIFLRTKDKELYPEKNNIGDTLHIKLSEALSASFPLAVYASEEETYPQSTFIDSTYRYNKGGFNKYFDDNLLQDMNVRLSNAIHIWNVFRYAYVYNYLDENQQEDLLKNTLREVLETKSVLDYYDAIWKMLATYKDAHIFFNIEEIDSKNSYTAPLSVIQINGKYYVRNIFQDSLKSEINIGDEILELDNEKIKHVAQRKGKYASGSKGNINTAVIINLLKGMKDSEIDLKLQNFKSKKIKHISLKRDFQFPTYGTLAALSNKKNRMLNKNTYYFNLSESPVNDTLLAFINDSTKNIVFDVRGYLHQDVVTHRILNKLISDTVHHEIIYSYNILSPQKKFFRLGPQVDDPENIRKKAKFYFLADKTTQSAPETFLDIIKHSKIGTIIGQPTSGANGNINYLSLPGNMYVTFSGIKTLNSDGSTHHLIGVIPDYLVDFTLDDIINSRDPYIVKALELINK